MNTDDPHYLPRQESCLMGTPKFDEPAAGWKPRHVCHLPKDHQGNHKCLRHGVEW